MATATTEWTRLVRVWRGDSFVEVPMDKAMFNAIRRMDEAERKRQERAGPPPVNLTDCGVDDPDKLAVGESARAPAKPKKPKKKKPPAEPRYCTPRNADLLRTMWDPAYGRYRLPGEAVLIGCWCPCEAWRTLGACCRKCAGATNNP